jgi:hypothetical protein
MNRDIFQAGLKQANLISMEIMSEYATLNGIRIQVTIDDLSTRSYARSGGISAGVESAVFVREDEFNEAGGKKGSIIKFDNGKSGQVQKISDFQGVLYLQLAPFKP